MPKNLIKISYFDFYSKQQNNIYNKKKSNKLTTMKNLVPLCDAITPIMAKKITIECLWEQYDNELSQDDNFFEILAISENITQLGQLLREFNDKLISLYEEQRTFRLGENALNSEHL